MRKVLGRGRFVHNSGRQRAEGHSIEFCARRILNEHASAGPIHIAYAARPIASASRQDDGYRIRAEVLCQGTQERVDGKGQAVYALLVAEEEPPVLDDHLLFGREQVNVVRLDLDTVFGQGHRHIGMPGKEFVHHALEIG